MIHHVLILNIFCFKIWLADWQSWRLHLYSLLQLSIHYPLHFSIHGSLSGTALSGCIASSYEHLLKLSDNSNWNWAVLPSSSAVIDLLHLTTNNIHTTGTRACDCKSVTFHLVRNETRKEHYVLITCMQALLWDDKGDTVCIYVFDVEDKSTCFVSL